MNWLVTFHISKYLGIEVRVDNVPDADAAITLAATNLEKFRPDWGDDANACILAGRVSVVGGRMAA